MGKLGITITLILTLGAIIGGSIIDHDLFLIVTKGDNIPIVGMLLIVMFFTWLSLAQAFKHDKLLQEDDGRQKMYDEMCKQPSVR